MGQYKDCPVAGAVVAHGHPGLAHEEVREVVGAGEAAFGGNLCAAPFRRLQEAPDDGEPSCEDTVID